MKSKMIMQHRELNKNKKRTSIALYADQPSLVAGEESTSAMMKSI
jgi:hypothetical protein